MKEDRFFTEEELNNFEDIDADAIRDHLEQVKDRPSEFVEQVMADVERLAEQETEQASAAAPTIREIYEKYKPIVKDKVLADTTCSMCSSRTPRKSIPSCAPNQKTALNKPYGKMPGTAILQNFCLPIWSVSMITSGKL